MVCLLFHWVTLLAPPRSSVTSRYCTVASFSPVPSSLSLVAWKAGAKPGYQICAQNVPMIYLIWCANVQRSLWIILRNGGMWWSHWKRRRWWGQKGLYEHSQMRTSIRYFCEHLEYMGVLAYMHTEVLHSVLPHTMQFIFPFTLFPNYILWLSFPSLLLLPLLSPFIPSFLFCPSSYLSPPLLFLEDAHGSNRGPSRNPGGVEQSTRPTLLSGFQSTTCEPMFVWSEGA